jgi:hypothetical protein
MKRVFLFTLLCVVFALLLTGCGGGNNTSTITAGAGNATIQFGDALNDEIAKFELTVSSITLTGVSPTATTGNLLSKSAEFEFTHTAGTLEPVTLANVPQGTYSGATLTVSNPEIVVINGTTPTKVPVTLSSTTITVTFANITVGTSPLFINFDLDLAGSVTLNGSPITSATVNPKFNVTSTTTPPAGNEGNEDHDDGDLEDVHGSVKSISAPNFTVTTNSTDITFATDANTRFKDGITQLSDLKVGDIVEVDGVTKSDGTKLATKVEREGGQNGEELEGLVSALDNPLTKITVVHQVDSSGNSNPPVTVDISVNASTVYSVRTDKLNLSSPPAFDATHIGKGQRIEGDSNGNASPILATKVKLREQALVGTVAASPAPTSSGFTITIAATSAFGTLSGATSIPVTFANGATLKTTPTAGATIRVRGLVFFNAGAYSMIAVRDDDNH